MAELATAHIRLLAANTHRVFAYCSALPSGHKNYLVELKESHCFTKNCARLKGMAELATAHTRLLAANTHRVFAYCSALPSGHKNIWQIKKSHNILQRTLPG